MCEHEESVIVFAPPPWYTYIVDDAERAYRQAVAIDGYDNVSVGYYLEAAVEKALSKYQERYGKNQDSAARSGRPNRG